MDGDGVVTFTCPEEHYDDVPKPEPACDVVPEWYKELGFEVGDGRDMRTVRACMSFMDAMNMGWIMKVPYDIEVEFRDGGKSALFNTLHDESFVEAHALAQIGGDENPLYPTPIMKFETPWSIRTGDGVSVLVMPPMNRYEPRFESFCGVIDSDNYQLRFNLPSMWKDTEYEGVVEAGTPIAQVIPFTRDGIVNEAVVRSESDEERSDRETMGDIFENTQGLYRSEMWEPKDGPRNIEVEQ